MKTKEVEERAYFADQVANNGHGQFTLRRGFYYTHGNTAEDFKNRVKNTFPEAEVIDYGEVWKPFKGGAPVQKQSHWFAVVRF